VVVAYGTKDSPEFQRQSRELAEALRATGRLRALIVGEGLNHFEMPETLADPSSALGRGVLTLLGLREESQQ
jgi:arylformamidase